MQSIGTLGGANSVANGLNDRSEIVGESELRPGSDASRAFIWSETGGMHSLGTLGGRHSSAAAVNNRLLGSPADDPGLTGSPRGWS